MAYNPYQNYKGTPGKDQRPSAPPPGPASQMKGREPERTAPKSDFNWDQYDQTPYFDAQGILQDDWLDSWAKSIARQFLQERMAMAQLRRFYDGIKSIEMYLKLQEKDFREVRADILGIQGLAYDAVGKEKAPESFRRFIEVNVQRSQDQKSFQRGFVKHFQAVVQYFGYYAKQGGGR